MTMTQLNMNRSGHGCICNALGVDVVVWDCIASHRNSNKRPTTLSHTQRQQLPRVNKPGYAKFKRWIANLCTNAWESAIAHLVMHFQPELFGDMLNISFKLFVLQLTLWKPSMACDTSLIMDCFFHSSSDLLYFYYLQFFCVPFFRDWSMEWTSLQSQSMFCSFWTIIMPLRKR